VRYAFKHVGAPLWITTVVLVAGFGLLISSSFVPNSDLGSLTALILIAALLLDFFMLPPLLMLFDTKKIK
jgi:predicted RND superfamily exporter protein